jgi:hypothetical protein
VAITSWAQSRERYAGVWLLWSSKTARWKRASQVGSSGHIDRRAVREIDGLGNSSYSSTSTTDIMTIIKTCYSPISDKHDT